MLLNERSINAIQSDIDEMEKELKENREKISIATDRESIKFYAARIIYLIDGITHRKEVLERNQQM